MSPPKILVHVCCAPCFTAPYFNLRDQGLEVHGFWYNHNIHPYLEYRKRLQALIDFASSNEIRVIYKDDYDLEEFLRNAVYRERNRCENCYHARLKYTAQIAARGKYDYFTTTLLYSKYQKHDRIIAIAESLSSQYNIPFHYQDFRQLWKEGIRISQEMNMYRQQYCGCVYSEAERYAQLPSLLKE
ncbi:MAG: epoxyqueuosine reductase QueH [Candidatus Cloacimonetes bacterium]|nr:epoxyqueuosine reductase QueH [Candidatus Cloacimonadota bacterium]